MDKYNKTKMKLHLRKGINMEIVATPFIRFCIGMAILLLALGMCGLMLAPLIGIFVK